MILRARLPILIAGMLALAGCTPEPAATTTTTQTETKQVGTTAQTTSETKVDSPAGETKATVTSYLGTVTVYTPGKSIEVMTGNKETHSVALDGAQDVVVIESVTAVGSKVLLVDEKGENGLHKITVTIAPPA